MLLRISIKFLQPIRAKGDKCFEFLSLLIVKPVWRNFISVKWIVSDIWETNGNFLNKFSQNDEYNFKNSLNF